MSLAAWLSRLEALFRPRFVEIRGQIPLVLIALTETALVFVESR